MDALTTTRLLVAELRASEQVVQTEVASPRNKTEMKKFEKKRSWMTLTSRKKPAGIRRKTGSSEDLPSHVNEQQNEKEELENKFIEDKSQDLAIRGM